MLPISAWSDQQLWKIWVNSYGIHILGAAIEINLFDFLAKIPATAQEVAEKSSLSVDGAGVLLRALVAMDLLEMREDRFCPTKVAQTYLLSNSPYSWLGMIRQAREIEVNWRRLLESWCKDVPTVYGEGVDMWEAHELDSTQARIFTEAMHSRHFHVAVAAAQIGKFDGITRLLDVGGGSGCFCIALAHEYPDMHFTILELPNVCPISREYVAQYGLTDRIEVVSGDMFKDPWPSGHDAIFFGSVFHDYALPQIELLAQKSLEALPTGGHIYVHEILLDETKTEPAIGALYSVVIKFFTWGRQYSRNEIEKLLIRTGFIFVEEGRHFGNYWLMRARKP